MYAETEAEYSNTKYKLHKLLTWLQEHCFEDHNWQQLAEKFHLTSRTAFRHIKEATGMTPDNYLKRLRLVSARVKLRETDMTITDVAYLCGFANSNHFTTLYKKVFGVTPAKTGVVCCAEGATISRRHFVPSPTCAGGRRRWHKATRC